MTRYRMFNQSRRKKSPAEEVFAIDDLLTEILQRLPTKVVVQLKLVAKQWQSVISSPHFSLSHTRYQDEEGFLKPSALFQDVVYLQPSTTFMFVPLDRDTTQLPSFDFIDAPYLKIMQSCTGLLLCISDFGNPMSYFVCNPVIRKSKTVSFPRPPALEHQLVGVSLAFDPIQSPYYQIIAIWQEVLLEKDDENNHLCSMSSNFSMDIYSSETDSWSASVIKFSSEYDIRFDHGVFLDGVIYWDSSNEESLCFNVDTVTLMPMPMPKPSRRYSGYRYFGESGGFLHLVVGRRPVWFLVFRIYEMLDDHSDWFFKYRIDLEIEVQTLVYMPNLEDYEVQWFAIHSDEDEGDSMVAIFRNGISVSYNFKEEEIRFARGCPEVENFQYDYDRFRACPYFETLSFV